MDESALRSALCIEDWVAGVAKLAAVDFSQGSIRNYITQHQIRPSSLAPYLSFSPDRYTRNLIYRNDLLECLAVCWEIGQASAIHDHHERLGWMDLVSGRLHVQAYSVQERDPERKTCRLIALHEATLDAESPSSYVDSEEAVHKVSNLACFGQRAVSVHIYQAPMSECEVYSHENGTYKVVQLSYAKEAATTPLVPA